MLEDMRRKQAEQARQFRASMPTVKQEQENVMKERGRQDLAGQLAGVRQDFGTRGLLYSGLRGAGEADASAQAAGQLATQRANLNQRLEGQAQQFEQGAISSGMELQRQKQAEMDADYEARLQAYNQRMGMIKGVGGALGKLGGMAIGGR